MAGAKAWAFTNLIEDWNLSEGWDWDADILVNLRSVKNREQVYKFCQKINDLFFYEFYASYYVNEVHAVTDPVKRMGAHILIKWQNDRFLGFDEQDVDKKKLSILETLSNYIQVLDSQLILSTTYMVNTMPVRADVYEEDENVPIED